MHIVKLRGANAPLHFVSVKTHNSIITHNINYHTKLQTMKKFYITISSVLLSAAITTSAMSVDRRVPVGDVLATEIPSVSIRAAGENGGMVITDLESQVYGRYSCEYYSPLPDENGKPYGNCIEQPMIVVDYFAEEPGDVNIGYLFILNGILKGHIDMETGTITIPSRFAAMYYVDPDDYSDPGLEIHFTAVDVVDGKYAANFDRPFTGKFEMHHGIITKITTDDIWGYAALDETGNQVGWMEIALNSNFYLGHGEMEYTIGATGAVEQTMIHGISNGKTAKVYNLFRSGWDNPVEIAIDGDNRVATVDNQKLTMGGEELTLVDESGATKFPATIRKVDWDTDKRDPAENPEDNSVIEFPYIGLQSGQSTVKHYANARIFMKEDVTLDSSGVENVVVDDDAAPTYYRLDGIRVAEPTSPGIYIERRGSKAVKRIVR